VATKIYLFLIYIHVGLIGPTKSSPHFINGSYGRLVTSFARLWIANPPVLWHASQDLESYTSLYIIGHQYPTNNIFLYIISIAKCPPDGPSCNFFITICAFIFVKHLRSCCLHPFSTIHHSSAWKTLFS
jgi:hypothetical protein